MSKFSEKGFAHFVVLLIILVGLICGLYLVQNPQILKSRASERFTTSSATDITLAPPVYVQYYVWYKKGSCPSFVPTTDWSHWAWWSETNNPCSLPYSNATWLRSISSPGYPLIGPYDGLNEDVMRWHIRLAKAAGIKGFFVSISAGDSDSWDGFGKMLKVASEENFKIGIEGWMPDKGKVDTWKTEVIRQLDYFATNSPYKSAFLEIDSKPAYWFNFYSNWTSIDNLVQFLDSRSVYWILAADLSSQQLQDINGRLSKSKIAEYITYASPTTTGWSYATDFTTKLAQMKNMGFLVIPHAYPGFDERFLSHETGRSRRYGLRDDGRYLTNFLNAATQARSDMILLESFNDWNEFTNLEPGMDIKKYQDLGQEAIFMGDPYKYLKILANYTGKNWQAPYLNCSIVDSLLRFKITKCGLFGI